MTVATWTQRSYECKFPSQNESPQSWALINGQGHPVFSLTIWTKQRTSSKSKEKCCVKLTIRRNSRSIGLRLSAKNFIHSSPSTSTNIRQCTHWWACSWKWAPRRNLMTQRCCTRLLCHSRTLKYVIITCCRRMSETHGLLRLRVWLGTVICTIFTNLELL